VDQPHRQRHRRHGGAGTLRLSTRAEGNDVVIEVGHTGLGMPPQVAVRALGAFYTTKDVGKGASLGLDIARRIVVERHADTITMDSRPGKKASCPGVFACRKS
jgi:signal transduction histidine kinase